jgi:hypothetical protein
VDSVIIRIAARAFPPLLIVLALYLLYAATTSRAAGSWPACSSPRGLRALRGRARARRRGARSSSSPRTWLGVGLCIAAGSLVLALTLDQPWFTGVRCSNHREARVARALRRRRLHDRAGVVLVMLMTLGRGGRGVVLLAIVIGVLYAAGST